jgi:hypothetical protein
MRIFYQILVLYLSVHGTLLLFREKNIWKQVGIVLVLSLFLLRLFLIA